MSSGNSLAAPPSFHLDASLEGRAELIARSIGATDSAVVFSATAGPLRSALEQSIPGLRVLMLEGALEPAEWDLRLAELLAGVYRVAVLDARLAWDAQLVVALRRWSPRAACVELAGVGASGHYESWPANLLIQRVRNILPTAAIVLVSAPEGRAARAELELLIGTTAGTRGSVVPPGVPLRVHQVGTERQRWRELLNITSAPVSPVIVVTPSRGRAAAIAGHLGSAAMAYHGGLLESERAKALDAYRRGNVLVLITTQSLPPLDDLAAPSAIALSHPPLRCEIVPRLAALLARAAVPGRLTILWNATDASAQQGHDLGVRPNLSDLRNVYRGLRSMARGGFARVVPESLTEVGGPAPGQPYLAASSLAALESAGYLRREDDIGRLAAVTISTRDPLPAVGRTLPPWQFGVPLTMDPLTIARRNGMGPTEWQRALAVAAQEGRLLYRPAGRERLYALQSPDSGGAARLQRLVQERSTVVARDKQTVDRWLMMPTCRVQTLALLLDLPPEPRCGLCDRCAPEAENRTEADTEPRDIVLRALAEVPLAVPERAAARIARQALFGAGKEEESRRSDAFLELLVRQGLIRREIGDLQPRLIISDEGRALLAGG